MQNEIWKDIKGYEGIYQVSNLGNVRSLDRYGFIKGNKTFFKGKQLKQKTDKRKYKRVSLCKEGKQRTITVHRLVMESFVENIFNYPCINHKDENPSNNKLDNLEWCTQKYNINYGTCREKIKKNHKSQINCESTSKKVINLDTNEIFPSIHEAGRRFKINFQNIYKCCKGKRNTAGGYRWGYLNEI